MSKIKNYMMDIQEDVWDIDGLETKIGEVNILKRSTPLLWKHWV